VLDFGIAKLVSAEEPTGKRLTTTGVLVGTAGYMAPEQGLGEPDIDHRADIWALGSILYEVLAGVRAVRGDNIGQAIKQIMTEKVVPLAKRISIDARVADLVDRMLAREPDARPSDLREVYDALAAHAHVRPPKFGPPAPSKLSAVDGSAPPASDLGHAPTEAVASSPAHERRSG
jgi:serine/threonine-protein kinase